MFGRILIESPIESLPGKEQDAIFKMSRDNQVFIKGRDGELWQVLDLTSGNDGKEALCLK